jgi:membrane protease subunit HflK
VLRKFLLWFLGLLFLGYLATGLYQVRAGEQAVVRRFGRVLDEPRLPGLNIGLPWGMDQVDIVAVDERRQITVGYRSGEEEQAEVAPPGQYITGDQSLIDLTITVHYRVDSESRSGVVQYVLNAGRIEAFLARAAEVALSQSSTGQVSQPIHSGEATSSMVLRIQEHLQQTLQRYELGVRVESVNLTYVQPPAKLAEDFREVNRAKQQLDSRRKEAELRRDAMLTSAHARALAIEANTRNQVYQRLSTALTEANLFLTQHWEKYKHAPSTYLATLHIDGVLSLLPKFKSWRPLDPRIQLNIGVPSTEK